MVTSGKWQRLVFLTGLVHCLLQNRKPQRMRMENMSVCVCVCLFLFVFACACRIFISVQAIQCWTAAQTGSVVPESKFSCCSWNSYACTNGEMGSFNGMECCQLRRKGKLKYLDVLRFDLQ
jgi:hypothetical protein